MNVRSRTGPLAAPRRPYGKSGAIAWRRVACVNLGESRIPIWTETTATKIGQTCLHVGPLHGSVEKTVETTTTIVATSRVGQPIPPFGGVDPA
jgi:hypothetical protein